MQVNRDLEKQFVNETKTQWGTPTDDYYNKYIKWLEDKAIQVQALVMQKIADADTADTKSILIHFLDQIRHYERESGVNLGYSDRETEEFVNIYLSENESNFSV